MSNKSVETNQDFESYLKEIEECLGKLNDENIGLHESMEIYKKGMEYLREAQKMLENAQMQCNEIKMQFEKKDQE